MGGFSLPAVPQTDRRSEAELADTLTSRHHEESDTIQLQNRRNLLPRLGSRCEEQILEEYRFGNGEGWITPQPLRER